MAAEVAAAGVSLLFFGIFAIIWLVIIAFGILATVFWIFMIVDVAKRKFKKEDEKIVWLLIIVLTGIIGSIIYYFVIKSKDKKPKKK